MKPYLSTTCLKYGDVCFRPFAFDPERAPTWTTDENVPRTRLPGAPLFSPPPGQALHCEWLAAGLAPTFRPEGAPRRGRPSPPGEDTPVSPLDPA